MKGLRPGIVTIQEFAKDNQISSAAIRHYEKLGLLDERHITRGPNGYRQFTPLAADRLELIRYGKMAGFSLRQLVQGIQRWEGDSMTLDEKRRVFTEQREIIDAKIGQLETIKAFIDRKLSYL